MFTQTKAIFDYVPQRNLSSLRLKGNGYIVVRRKTPAHLSHSKRTKTMMIRMMARPTTPNATYRPFLTGISGRKATNKKTEISHFWVIQWGSYAATRVWIRYWCSPVELLTFKGPHETAAVQSLQYSDCRHCVAYRLLTRNKYAFLSETLDQV